MSVLNIKYYPFCLQSLPYDSLEKTLEESLKAFHTFRDAQTHVILLSLSCCSQAFLVGVLIHWALSPVNDLRKPHPTADNIQCKQPGLFGGISPDMTVGFVARPESRYKLSNEISNKTQFMAVWVRSFHSFCSKDRPDLPANRQQSLYMQALVQ